MTVYQNFIGLDIGKFTFVAACYGEAITKEYENNPIGVKSFLSDFKRKLSQSLIILETTGGYEMRLLLTLHDKGLKVHRSNTRKVKNFIKSFGNSAKTDSLDAKALARYGYERHPSLELFKPSSKKMLILYELVERRRDLSKILVAEKSRLKAPKANVATASFKAMIEFTTNQIQLVNEQIDILINSDEALRVRREILETIPGIGKIISANLAISLPELGTLDRRKIASLAGLAPTSNDSGKFKGYRRCCYGRNGIKPLLFISAMAARNSNSNLKVFYEKLIAQGKKKMVALVALMRKILVIANARIRDLIRSEEAIKV